MAGRFNRAIKLAAIGTGVALARREVRRRRAFDLPERVVLITGSSRGLGLALAESFAREGARVVICARNAAQLELARERIVGLGYGTEVLAVPCDVTDPTQVERLVGSALERFGRIDVLVTNAGTIAVGPLAAQTLEDFEMAMNSMFWGTVYPTFAVLPSMRERGDGRIVNITSIGGKASVPHLLPYCSAKFAAVGFSEGIRAELAREGIGVITVVPGLMRTGSHVHALFKGKHEQEYSLFSVLASLPGLTLDVNDAADRVVRAVQHGDTEVTLGTPARLLARFHGAAPGLTGDIMGVANRILPTAAGPTPRRYGYESETAVSESFLTSLGREAAEEYQPGYGAADGEDRLIEDGTGNG
jgi:NAD(P)-dependent dehydrogenase (short-subunit alcohol dehydrogenase family)